MEAIGINDTNTGTKGEENSDLVEYFFKWQDIFTGNRQDMFFFPYIKDIPLRVAFQSPDLVYVYDKSTMTSENKRVIPAGFFGGFQGTSYKP